MRVNEGPAVPFPYIGRNASLTDARVEGSADYFWLRPSGGVSFM